MKESLRALVVVASPQNRPVSTPALQDPPNSSTTRRSLASHSILSAPPTMLTRHTRRTRGGSELASPLTEDPTMYAPTQARTQTIVKTKPWQKHDVYHGLFCCRGPFFSANLVLRRYKSIDAHPAHQRRPRPRRPFEGASEYV